MMCSENLDCDTLNTNRLCYTNYSGGDTELLDEFGCGCNSLYGWGGPNCDEYTASTIFSIVSMVVLALLSIYTFIMTTILFIIQVKQSGFTVKYHTVAFISNIVSALCLFGWSLAVALSAAVPSGPWVGPQEFYANGGDLYFGRYNFLTTIFMPLTLVGVTVTVLTVVLLFFEITEKTIQLSLNASMRIKYMRRFTLGFAVVLALLGIGSAIYARVLRRTSIVGLAVFVPVLMISFMLSIGAIRLTRLLANAQMTEQRVLTNVRNTTTKLVLGMCVAGLSMGVVSTLDTFFGGWTNHTVIGGFSAIKILHHMVLIALGIIVVSVYQFLRSGMTAGTHKISFRKMTLERAKSSSKSSPVQDVSKSSELGKQAMTASDML